MQERITISRDPKAPFWARNPSRPAFATFVGVRLDDRTATVAAVGDSVAFLVQGRTRIAHFPPMTPEEFGSQPHSLCSLPTAFGADTEVQFERWELQPGDRILLATDALAKWLLVDQERLPQLVERLEEGSLASDWGTLVEAWRDEHPPLDDDDTTLVALSVEVDPSTSTLARLSELSRDKSFSGAAPAKGHEPTPAAPPGSTAPSFASVSSGSSWMPPKVDTSTTPSAQRPDTDDPNASNTSPASPPDRIRTPVTQIPTPASDPVAATEEVVETSPHRAPLVSIQHEAKTGTSTVNNQRARVLDPGPPRKRIVLAVVATLSGLALLGVGIVVGTLIVKAPLTLDLHNAEGTSPRVQQEEEAEPPSTRNSLAQEESVQTRTNEVDDPTSRASSEASRVPPSSSQSRTSSSQGATDDLNGLWRLVLGRAQSPDGIDSGSDARLGSGTEAANGDEPQVQSGHEAVTEEPQREAVTEEPQREAVTEEPQREVETEDVAPTRNRRSR